MSAVTIFTPTYNRAYTLPKLYTSLCRQTSMDFEWLIVDDGSTDHTGKLVREWQQEAPFIIRYEWQPNGGKMRAHNHGVKLCRTPYFLCVDSDDFVDDHCVEQILSQLSLIERHDEVAGIIAYKAIRKRDGQYRVAKQFPLFGLIRRSALQEKGFRGEMAMLFKTEVLRRYPFPEIEGEKFVSEEYVYSQIDREYRFLAIREVWNYCEYMDDGYTHNVRRVIRENPKGFALLFLQRAQFCPERLSVEKAGCIIRYFIFSRLAGIQSSREDIGLSPFLYRLLWFASYMVAALFNYPRR